MKYSVFFALSLAASVSHSAPADRLQVWIGKYRVKSCIACSANYRLAPNFSLRDLKEVEVTNNSNLRNPVCIDRIYIGEFQKTTMGNCFTFSQISGDSSRLMLRKTFSDSFDLAIVLTRVKSSREVHLAIRRVAQPAFEISPLGESANLAIELTLEEISPED